MPNYEDLYSETRYGFKTPDPFGVRRIGVRSVIHQFTQGNDYTMIVTDTEQDLLEANCNVVIRIKVNQFKEEFLWEANYQSSYVVPGNADNKVSITFPTDLVDTLSRGSYIYTVTRIDSTTLVHKIVETGWILVDYDANSPYPEVPFNGQAEASGNLRT